MRPKPNIKGLILYTFSRNIKIHLKSTHKIVTFTSRNVLSTRLGSIMFCVLTIRNLVNEQYCKSNLVYYIVGIKSTLIWAVRSVRMHFAKLYSMYLSRALNSHQQVDEYSHIVYTYTPHHHGQQCIILKLIIFIHCQWHWWWWRGFTFPSTINRAIALYRCRAHSYRSRTAMITHHIFGI